MYVIYVNIEFGFQHEKRYWIGNIPGIGNVVGTFGTESEKNMAQTDREMICVWVVVCVGESERGKALVAHVAVCLLFNPYIFPLSLSHVLSVN